jgi:hypothetical protein
MTDTGFTCGTHEAFIYDRGAYNLLGELTPLLAVKWQRIRDDVSQAEVTVATHQCCDLLGDLRTLVNELHIRRNGVDVWQGPITRIEYEWDVVRIFAEDILWVTKRTVLTVGYNQSYPNIGDTLDRMDWLLRDQCYSINSDPWRVLPHLRPVRHSYNEPRTSRVVNAFQMYVWEDFDKYAEDYGADYTVINRDIYYFDIHLSWVVLPALDEQYMSQFPRIVEYGYQTYTRGYVTNGKGYAGMAQQRAWVDTYGWIDLLISNTTEGTSVDQPSSEDLAQWSDTAARNIADSVPAPTAIVIPANTTLLPGAPWQVEDLIPGAWFPVTVTRMCRTVSEWQRLHEVVVTEAPPGGETVAFTAISAPSTRVWP